MIIFLDRIYKEDITLGKIIIGLNGNDNSAKQNRFIFHCIEPPWKDNKANISCVPEGKYEISLTINSRFGKHIDILNVHGRTGIKIHSGNKVYESLGCIFIGEPIGNDVYHSRFTLDILFDILEKYITDRCGKEEKLYLWISKR